MGFAFDGFCGVVIVIVGVIMGKDRGQERAAGAKDNRTHDDHVWSVPCLPLGVH